MNNIAKILFGLQQKGIDIKEVLEDLNLFERTLTGTTLSDLMGERVPYSMIAPYLTSEGCIKVLEDDFAIKNLTVGNYWDEFSRDFSRKVKSDAHIPLRDSCLGEILKSLGVKVDVGGPAPSEELVLGAAKGFERIWGLSLSDGFARLFEKQRGVYYEQVAQFCQIGSVFADTFVEALQKTKEKKIIQSPEVWEKVDAVYLACQKSIRCGLETGNAEDLKKVFQQFKEFSPELICRCLVASIWEPYANSKKIKNLTQKLWDSEFMEPFRGLKFESTVEALIGGKNKQLFNNHHWEIHHFSEVLLSDLIFLNSQFKTYQKTILGEKIDSFDFRDLDMALGFFKTLGNLNGVRFNNRFLSENKSIDAFKDFLEREGYLSNEQIEVFGCWMEKQNILAQTKEDPAKQTRFLKI